MLAAGLALAASLSWGVADFFAGVRSRRHALLTVLLVSQTAGLVAIVAVVAGRGDGPPDGRYILYAVGAGLAGTLGIVCLYRALAIGSMTIVAPLAATAVVVPVAVGLARGERPSTLQDLGIGLAIVGVLVASREPSGARGSRVAAGVWFALGAAAAIGVVLVALDAASEGDALWSSLVLRVTTFSAFVLAGLLLRPPLDVDRRDLVPLATIGILDTAGNALFALATSRGLLSVVSPLGQLYPIVTVLLARLLLGERVSRPQRAGVAAALAGVGLVTVG